ncbi:MAG: metalloregulator ArsR/SmtB family transcription factor [Pseudomonadales bacterium]|jgi:rhodanese-related sulfurtransferase|nr:metalloregulator ArsR/SmtB family transcription factor [Pseudomonadales bacterium]MDP7358767.1 metalloregulator ArsR/SmtB family transcription factor [Pseudomonadales bacterium]MDP7597928.1 metalloregulator ArsR/SmtB family transcription factor [Pseudomonadales bacterium]HJN50769.1 metalloregulator ArsR/SmtB family transcription factor [Pseudomonadales bacterium]|tara:strand:- start:1121 stop:1789 length:669 start_codon:yes stop_codon:yes gene_type:complete
MATINVKKELLEQLAVLGRALGSANRLELLEFLAQGERSVESLAKLTGMTVANTSQHLRQLRQAGLVTTRKQGLFVFNQLADEAVVDLLACMREIAEHNLSKVDLLIRTYLLAKDSLEPISANELLQRVQDNRVTVLDVRPTEEFSSGHLPGAVNIPMHELEQRLAELPNGPEVVAYCRGPYCMLSFEAVAKLRDKGYRARRLEDGYPEWKRAGFPVEAAPI